MPSDTFSLVRSLLESQQQTERIYTFEEEAKVIARSQRTFLTEKPQKSRADYRRRLRQRHTGFNSLAHIPYRPFADLKHTDAYALIAETWDLPLHDASGETSLSTSNKDCARAPSYTNSHTIKVVREAATQRVGKNKTKVRSRTAGLSAIQLHLSSSARAAREVAAGSTFYDTLLREDERKRFLQKMRAPRKIRRGGVCVSVHNPSIFLPLLVQTAASKTCLARRRLPRRATEGEDSDCSPETGEMEEEEEEEVANVCQKVGPNIHVAMAAAHFKMNFGHQGRKKEISPAKRLQMRSCLLKMKTIYSILCSLYNMKSKDLKEKHPLTLEAIKQMSVKPQANREGVHLHSHRLTHNTHNSHTPSHHLHPHKNPGHGVETWEDLRAMSRHQSHSHREPPSSHMARTPVSGHPQHPPRVVPPWQRQVVFVDSNEKSNDPAVVMAECCQAFQAAKDQVSEQTKTLLGKREKGSVQSLSVKARELRLGVDREGCLREMRERAHSICRADRATEKNRPAWYTQLEKEVAVTFKPSLVGSDWQLSTWRTVARWFLQRIEFFVFSDTDAIPRVMEKLCLLVMSLAPDQLCLAPVLDSVQFVLEAVLELPVRLCRQWLQMRGLPVTAVPLPPKPVIVLGLTV